MEKMTLLWNVAFLCYGGCLRVLGVSGAKTIFDGVYLSTEVLPSDPSFRSIEIMDIQKCIHHCKLHPSCIAINYRRHGNVCMLSHQNSVLYTATVTRQHKVGYMSWMKSSWDQTAEPDVQVCQANDPRPDCKTYCVNRDIFTPAGGTFYGNLIEAGSQIMYEYNGFVMVANCLSTGVFKRCTAATLSDGTHFKYRVYQEEVDFDEAKHRCSQDDASLLQLTTEIKHAFFKDLLLQPEYTGGYWFDANDVEGVWQTTDKVQIPESIINEHDEGQECARLSPARNYHGRNRSCSHEYKFICEWMD